MELNAIHFWYIITKQLSEPKTAKEKTQTVLRISNTIPN